MNFTKMKEQLKDQEFATKQVEIHYHPTCSIPNISPFEAVVQVSGREIRFKVPCICVGFDGPGPREVAKVLDFLGVKYSREDIFTDVQRDDSGFIHLAYSQAAS